MKSSVEIFADNLLDQKVLNRAHVDTLKEIANKIEPPCCKVII